MWPHCRYEASLEAEDSWRHANWCLFGMAAQMAEMPEGNVPMAREVVLIYTRSAVMLDLSSMSGEAQLGPVAETQTEAQRCDTEPDRLLQAQAALGRPNQIAAALPVRGLLSYQPIRLRWSHRPQ